VSRPCGSVLNGCNPEKFREFTDWLHERHQHYIPLVDAAIGTLTDENDSYKAYEGGKDLDVYIKNEDGTDFVGRVWPG